jgi:hypothetical protein
MEKWLSGWKPELLRVHIQNKCLFAALVAIEQLGLELAIAVFGGQQFLFTHPRLQGARLLAVAPTAPLSAALVVLGTKKTGHLSFQNMLHRALNQFAEEILSA